MQRKDNGGSEEYVHYKGNGKGNHESLGKAKSKEIDLKPRVCLSENCLGRQGVWDNLREFVLSMNLNSDMIINDDYDDLISKENNFLTTTSNLTDDQDTQLQEIQRYPNVKVLFEDIKMIKGDTAQYFNDCYRNITHKDYGVKSSLRHLNNVIELQCFSGDIDSIWSAEFSYNGKYLATGGKSGALKIWEVFSYEDSINAYQANTMGTYLQFIGEQPYKTYAEHHNDIIDIAWSQKNLSNLVTVSVDNTAILWDITKEGPMQIFKHNSIVSCVHFYPGNIPVNISGVINEEDVFITGCFDKIIRIWGKSNVEPVAYINVSELITSITFFPEGNYIAMGTSNGQIMIYECTDKLRYSYSFHCRNKLGRYSDGRKVTGIYFRNQKEALITTNDSRLRIINGTDGELLWKFKGHSNEEGLIRADYEEVYGMLISASDDGYVYLWNADHSTTLKNKYYEYYQPFNDKEHLPSCSLFTNDRWIDEYNKKLHKINETLYAKTIMINTSCKGLLQVVLNYEVIN